MYNYEVKFNLDKTIKDLGLEERGRVQQFVTHETLRLCTPFIPFDTGALVQSGRVENETDIVWGGLGVPYARRLYYHPEYNFQNKGDSENGGIGRGAYWVSRMLQNGGMKKIEDGAREVLKR